LSNLYQLPLPEPPKVFSPQLFAEIIRQKKSHQNGTSLSGDQCVQVGWIYHAGPVCFMSGEGLNGGSFIVRHAYFTGADKPYEKLKRP
jgi:hypothetical protein